MVHQLVIWLMVLASSLVFISARPETSGTHSPTGTMATILKSHFENNGDGNFQWEFETSDGIKAQQTGHALPPNSTGSLLRSGGDDEDSSNDNGGEAVMGSYSYKAPNGEVISLSYIADQNGFQPMGSHLPTSPPNPFPVANNDSTSETF